MASYTVRVAVESDCPEIKRLFQEQENNEDLKLQLTLEDLKKYGFGEDSHFIIIVAHCISDTSSTPLLVGYMFFSKIFCTYIGKTLLVDDLYVSPKYRTQGISKKLGHLMAKIAEEEDYQQVQWYKPPHSVEVGNICHFINAENESKFCKYIYMSLFKDSLEKLNNLEEH
ncbi:diamine acetyltransferase 2-like [Argonauta hians]